MDDMRGSIPRRVHPEPAPAPERITPVTTTHCWPLGTVQADGGAVMAHRHPTNTVLTRGYVFVEDMTVPEGCRVVLQVWRVGVDANAIHVGEIRKGVNALAGGLPVKAWEKLRLNMVTVDVHGKPVDTPAVLMDVWVSAEFLE